MNNFKKINLFRIKCQQITDNNASIELKYIIDTINRLYSNCTKAINRAYLIYYLAKSQYKRKIT